MAHSNNLLLEPINPQHRGADQIYHARQHAAAEHLDYVVRADQGLGELTRVMLNGVVERPLYDEYFEDFSAFTGINVPNVLQSKDRQGNVIQKVDKIHGVSLKEAVYSGQAKLADIDAALALLPTFQIAAFDKGERYPADVFTVGQYMYGTPHRQHPTSPEGPDVWMVDVSPITIGSDPTDPADARFAVGNLLWVADMIQELEGAADDANPDNRFGHQMPTLRRNTHAAMEYFQRRFGSDPYVTELLLMGEAAMGPGEPIDQERVDDLMF